MKSELFYLFVSVFVLATSSLFKAHAQNTYPYPSTGPLGIGVTIPSASSILEVKSTTKGVLFPRMTAAQKAVIPSPAPGLIVYQIDGLAGFYYYQAGWQYLNPSTVNTSLSNLSATSINQPLIPANTILDLGSSLKKWRNLYLSGTLSTNSLSLLSGSLVLDKASNIGYEMPYLQTKRSRGTATAPAAVVKDDILNSFFVSAYNGSNYAFSGSIAFLVDSTPTGGRVPARITFQTGTTERLRIGGGGNFNFNTNQLFIEQATGNIGIGTTSPYHKLEVAGGVSFEGLAENKGGLVAGDYYNFSGTAISGSSEGGYGAYSGVHGESLTGTGVSGLSHMLGVSGQAMNGTGVYGSSNGGVGGSFYSQSSDGLDAGTGDYTKYAGYFSGDIYAQGVFQTSDKNLKKDIQEFSDAMSVIIKLQPKKYEFKKDNRLQTLNLPRGYHYGLIAQELEQVLPNLVKETKHEINKARPQIKMSENHKVTVTEVKKEKETINIKAVNYTELIPIMVKGMQEQQLEIQEEKKINEELRNELQELKSMIHTLTKQGKNLLIQANLRAYIGQNTPNPTNGSTLISYYVPDNAKIAQLLITDMKGRVVKTYRLLRGTGQVTVRNDDITSGSYNYTLIVDGNRIDTKQLLLIK